MLVTVAMLMTKEEGMKFTAAMLPTATAMMTLDIFILQMILAIVTVNWATLILATSIAIIPCHIHYITTLATHILDMIMTETMVILMSFLILMITVVMYAVDMELKKQAVGDGNACVESLDCNEELSEEEMAVVEAARHVVECSLDFIKQLLYVAAEVPAPQGTEE